MLKNCATFLKTCTKYLTMDSIAGSVIKNMPNYYYKTIVRCYFPGMLIAILPMIPGCFAIVKLLLLKRKKSDDQVNWAVYNFLLYKY